jgi:porin
VTLTTDFHWNVDGGLMQGDSQLGSLDVILEADMAEFGFWDAGLFHLHLLGTSHREKVPSEYSGDIQVASNIEADESFRVFEAWYEHQLGKVSVLVGLHDFNSDFSVIENAELFLNSSFGIGPDISQVGPSIFPVSSVGLRALVSLTEKSYFLTGIYDGVPGDPDDQKGTHVRFDRGDGVFLGIEYGRTLEEPTAVGYTKMALGAWLHTSEVLDLEGRVKDSNTGAYFIFEQTPSDHVSMFMHGGVADEDMNRLAWYAGAGLVFPDVAAGPLHDELGMAVAVAGNGDTFLRNNPDYSRQEIALELSWRIHVHELCSIQPDVQYIWNPGAAPRIEDAIQIGVRFALSF